MPEIVLELIDVSKSYNEGLPNQVDVLKGLNFSLHAGEMVGLISPSGAGKTTMLNIAGLLDRPSFGAIQVADKKVFDFTVKPSRLKAISDKVITQIRRDYIGFVYQFHHLLPEFTALENVELPKLLKGTATFHAKNEAKELLRSVGLMERLFHKPSQMSGGEQQRVALCRALANQPKILLADEPTGNLDAHSAKDVFNILMDMVRNTGMAAIIATHNVELVSKLDRVIRIDSGKLVQVDI